MQRGRIFPPVDANLSVPARQEAKVAERPPGVRLRERTKGSECLVGRDPTYASHEAFVQLRDRNRPTSVQAGEVTVEEGDEFLAPHEPHRYPQRSAEPFSR